MFLNVFDHLVLPLSIIKHLVALALIHDRPDKVASFPGDGDDRVDVAVPRELDGVRTDGGGSSIDDEWGRFGSRVPRRGESKVSEECDGGGIGCQGNSCGLYRLSKQAFSMSSRKIT